MWVNGVYHGPIGPIAHNIACMFDGEGTGGGAGGGTGAASGDGKGGTAGNGTTAGNGDGTQNPAPPTTVSKAEHDALLARFTDLEKQQKAAEKAARDAATKAAEEQGKFKELYEATTAELEKLKPVAESAKRYSDALTKQLESAMQGVPDHIKSLLTGLDPLAQLEWLNANADKVKAAGGNGTAVAGANANAAGGGSGGAAGGTGGAPRGSGTNPNPAGNVDRAELVKREIAALAGTGNYGSVRVNGA